MILQGLNGGWSTSSLFLASSNFDRPGLNPLPPPPEGRKERPRRGYRNRREHHQDRAEGTHGLRGYPAPKVDRGPCRPASVL